MRELKAKMTMDTRSFDSGVKRAGTGLDNLANNVAKSGGGMGLLNTAMTGLALGGISALVTGTGAAAVRLGELGLRSMDVTHNLEAFAGGAAQAEQYLRAVEQASGGTIDKMQAAAAATRMLQMHLAGSTDEMALYIEGAVRLGDQTMTAGQRVQEMIALLKNLNVNMLDNFGLSRAVVMGRVEELKATQNLSREEAMLIAIREEIGGQLKTLGAWYEGGALQLDRYRTAMQNAAIALGEWLGPGLLQGLERLTMFVGALSGNTEALKAYARAAAATGDPLYGLILMIIEEAEANNQATLSTDVHTAAHWRALGATQELSTATHDLTGHFEEQYNALQRGIAAVDQYSLAMLRMMTSQEEVTRGIAEATAGFGRVDPTEAIGGLEGAERAVTSRLMAIAGLVDPGTLTAMYDRYITQLVTLHRNVEGVTDFELARRREMIMENLNAELQVYTDAIRAQEDLQAKRLQAERDFRSRLDQLTQPTSVTQEDLEAAAAGAYEEKWDEAVRQRRAAVLNQSPEWLGLIPEDIRGDPGRERGWLKQYEKEFYRGLHPEDINFDAIENALRESLADEAGRENLLNIIQQEMGLRGIEVPISLVPTAGAGGPAFEAMDVAGEQMAGDFATGFQGGVEDLGVASAVQTRITEDVDANGGLLWDSGWYIWKAVEPGVIAAIKKTEYGREIALAVAPIVAEILDNRGWG